MVSRLFKNPLFIACLLSILSACQLGLNQSTTDSTTTDSFSINAFAITNALNNNYLNSTSATLLFTTNTSDYSDYCILENLSNVASCVWTAGALPSTYTLASTQNTKTLYAWIRNASTTEVSPMATSNAITLDSIAPSLTLGSLTGGQTIYGGVPTTITWSGSDTNTLSSPIRIEYSSNSGLSWTTVVASTSNSGSYSWTPPNVASSTYRVRIKFTDLAGNVTTDASSSDFSIAVYTRVITVTAPNGSESLKGGDSTTLAWTSSGLPAGASTADLYYSTNNGGTWTTITTGETNGDSNTYNWSVPTVNDTQVLFKVIVTDSLSISASDTSDSTFVIDSTAPAAPSGLSLSTPASSPNWDDTPSISISGVTSGDTVKLFTDSNCSGASEVASAAASYTSIILTASSLSVGTHHFYASATDPAGNVSNCSTATVAYQLTAGPPPAAPTGVAALATTSNIDVSWSASAGASDYTVFRSTTSGSGYSALAACSSIASTSCSDNTVSNGTTYHYVVVATNANGDSAYSSEVSGRAIASFSISSVVVNETSGPNALLVSWGSATGAATYDISWGTGGSPTGTASANGVTSPYTITSLNPGTTYTVRVTAKNDVGVGTAVYSSTNEDGIPMSRPILNSLTQLGTGELEVDFSAGTGSTATTLGYGTVSNSYTTTVSTSASSPTLLSRLTTGTMLYFMVTATNTSGSLRAASQSIVTPTNGTSHVSVWSTSAPGESITLPIISNSSYQYNFTVNWGDSTSSTVTAYNDPDISHTYASAGTYAVTIQGLVEGWSFNNGGSKLKVISVSDFGNLGWKDIAGGFYGCSNLLSFKMGLTPQVSSFANFLRGTNLSSGANFTTVDTRNLLDLSYTFSGTQLTSLNLSQANTSKVTSLNYTFLNSSALTSLNVSFQGGTHSVTSMIATFRGLTNLASLDLSSFSTENVTNMSYLFANMSSLTTLNLNNFNTSLVTSMTGMFKDTALLATLSLHPTNFDTSNVTDMSEMFSGASSLTSLDLAHFNLNGPNFHRFLYGASTLSSIEFKSGSAIGSDMSEAFTNCTSLSSINFRDLNTSAVTNTSWMFANTAFSSLDLSGLDLTNVTDISGMFSSMTHLTTLTLPVFGGSTLFNMSQTFKNLSALNALDIRNINTSKVTNFSQTFYGTKLSSFSHNLNLASSVNISGMFKNADVNSLDLSGVGSTSAITSADDAFDSSSLTSLNVTSWDSTGFSSSVNVIQSSNPSLTVYCDNPGIGTFFGKTCN